MKGGVVSVTNSRDIFNIFRRNAGNIQVELIGASSSGGYLYRFRFTNPIQEFISIYPGTANVISYPLELLEKISKNTNKQLQNNVRILMEYARICCMNSFNQSLNEIQLKESTIQEKIILVS